MARALDESAGVAAAQMTRRSGGDRQTAEVFRAADGKRRDRTASVD